MKEKTYRLRYCNKCNKLELHYGKKSKICEKCKKNGIKNKHLIKKILKKEVNICKKW